MTLTEDEKGVLQTGTGVLMTLGTVAAKNIAATLNAPEAWPEIETAIKDEIDMLSGHFTMAFADVSTAHEVAEAKLKADFDAALADAIARFNAKVTEIKSTYNWTRAHIVAIAVFAFGCGTLGAVVERLL